MKISRDRFNLMFYLELWIGCFDDFFAEQENKSSTTKTPVLQNKYAQI